MSNRFFQSIPGRMVGLFLSLTLASLATVTYLFYATTHSVISTSIESHLQTIAESKSEVISRWMTEREHDVEVVAKNTTVVDHTAKLVTAAAEHPDETRQQLSQLLRLVRDQYGAYHDIFLLAPDERVVASSRGDASKPVIEDRMLFEAIRRGRSYSSRTYMHPELALLALAIASPIETTSGELLGAVVAVVDMSAINAMTDEMGQLTTGEVYLVNADGVFVTHRDRRRVLRDDIADVEGIASAISGRSGVARYTDYRGVPVVGAYQWLPRWRWGLIAEIDQQEAFAPIAETRRTLLLIVGLVTIAVVLGVFLAVRNIVRPLRELTSAVQAVASGQLDQKLDIAGDDEVGYLTSCFNQMSTSLTEARSAMDRRIRNATARLEQKNAQLEAANDHFAQVNAELQTVNRELEEQRALVAQTARFAAMGEMAAGIAHEINNPLTTMKNLVHSMRGDLVGDDHHARDLAVVAEEIDKINRLVLNFLRYARPPKANFRPVDVAEVVAHTLQLLKPQAKQKQLNVCCDLDVDLPDVMADREQLTQVLVNLVLNAIQASPDGADLRVSATRVLRQDADRPSSVRISVTDQGPGVSEKSRSRIFSPFFTTKAQGSGLGLALSQRMIEEQGGEISFSSVFGEGATFYVTLKGLTGYDDEPDSDPR